MKPFCLIFITQFMLWALDKEVLVSIPGKTELNFSISVLVWMFLCSSHHHSV